MKLIIEETTEKMSESAMQIVLGEMMQDKQVNISLTSGRSPEKMYEMMVPAIKGKAKYKDVQYWLFDENPYDGDEYGPNWYDMQKMIFGPAEIEDERVHHLTRENYTEYDEQVRRAGGIDVMVIGLGWDGHFCGNCPRCTPFDIQIPVYRQAEAESDIQRSSDPAIHLYNGSTESDACQTTCHDCKRQ